MRIQNIAKDETLRLLYIKQETDFIAYKISYNYRSLYLCLVGSAGGPVFYFANLFYVGSDMFFLLLGCLLWAILGFFSTLGIIPIILNIRKYKHMRAEHREFLIKYNRMT